MSSISLSKSSSVYSAPAPEASSSKSSSAASSSSSDSVNSTGRSATDGLPALSADDDATAAAGAAAGAEPGAHAASSQGSEDQVDASRHLEGLVEASHRMPHLEDLGDLEIDRVSVSHGLRELRYDADAGFFLNREHFKVRGFCDHNSFAIVGMAVPERISLFRAQASRAVGGNGRRTSHNPPDAAVLDIYDRLGVVVMDENRLFGNESAYVSNMGAMVKRDRNHASVVIWSFCNEFGCEGAHEAGGPAFRDVAYRLDGSRPTLANMFTFGDLLSNTIDVQVRSRTPYYSPTAPYSLVLLSITHRCPTPQGVLPTPRH